MSNATAADGGVRKGKLGQRIAYACGNLGQAALYNAMGSARKVAHFGSWPSMAR